MYIYKITNTINGRWYIGKTNGQDPNYMGSGKLLKQAYKKYGQENFVKEVLETCTSEQELNLREQHWIQESGALSDPLSYNLAEGGGGGDLSKFIPYDKIDYRNHKMEGARKWWNSLTKEAQQELHARQAAKRTKGWYVSRIDDPTETYVQNISKWCEEHGVDKSTPSGLNDPNSRLFQKQTKGWRIRRSDMPELLPYINRRFEPTDNKCKGRKWKLVDGKRVWSDKYSIVED
jgi:hypothetical protein